MFIPASEKKEFKLVPEGVNVGILVEIIDLGSHWNERYEKSERKVLLTWETPDELAENGKPLLVGNRYTASCTEKSNIVKMIKSWTGDDPTTTGLDLRKYLGRPGLLNISHSRSEEKVYANVMSVMPLMKGQTVPEQVHNAICFYMDVKSNLLDHDLFLSLPEYIRKMIEKSPEYIEIMARRNGTYVNRDDNDGLPGHITEEVQY